MRSSPRLIPELVCSDLDRSLAFYCDVLGFSLAFDRPEDRFAFLEREGAALMLEQPMGRSFVNGKLTHPYGRGINLMIEVSDISALLESVRKTKTPFYLDIEDKWYRDNATEAGNRQFVIADPDGYLLRFFQDLGVRPATGH